MRDKRWKLHGNGKLIDIVADPEELKPFAAGADSSEGSSARSRLENVLVDLK